eukprot:jgi/Tetstr1/435080/TSEL_024049.t1
MHVPLSRAAQLPRRPRPPRRCPHCLTLRRTFLLLLVCCAVPPLLWLEVGRVLLWRAVDTRRYAQLLRVRAAADPAADSEQVACRFVPSRELLEQIDTAGLRLQQHGSPPPLPARTPGNSSGPPGGHCRQAGAICHEDALCHVNQWEATLAKPICQRERTQGCGPHQHGPGRINPEFCNHCTAARQADHLRCTVTRNHCEAAMRRCFEEGGAGGAGPQGTLRWLSFWDENAYDPAEFLGWANFGFSGNVSRICEGAAAGMRHMLKVNGYFFQRAAEEVKGKRRLELQPTWRTKWTAPSVASHQAARFIVDFRWEGVKGAVSRLLASGAIFGIYLGDELIWNGLPPSDLEAVASAVRHDFPRAVIWLNEARPPLKNGLTQFQRRLKDFKLPAAVTWLSTDSYHFGPNPEHVAETRRFYNRYIYPKLLPHQSVVLVPGSFASEHNPMCNKDCYEEFAASDARKYIEWARMDPRVVAVVPYHWNRCPYCVRTRNEIGTKDMNKPRAVWQDFGRELHAAQAERLATACRPEVRSGNATAVQKCVSAAMAGSAGP